MTRAHRKTSVFTWSRMATATLLLGVGCSKVIGLNDSEVLVACVADADCRANERCVHRVCECATACGDAGASGQAPGAGGSTGRETGGVGGTGTAGDPGAKGGQAGRRAAGGTGGTSPATGGKAGEPATGGMSLGASAGEGGEGGEAGGNEGGISSGGAGEGGGGGEPAVCPACFVCDGDGNIVDGESACHEDVCQGDGVCMIVRSCDGVPPNACDSQSCCRSLPMLAGWFIQSCDSSCISNCLDRGIDPQSPTHLTPHSLDVFEVTVARFRRFFTQYEAAKPTVGSGRNLQNPDDNGWGSDWSDRFLPEKATDLSAALQTCDGPLMWTDQAPLPGAQLDHEQQPMNCVTWYEAQAFCIWDGGRLPTEAEWNHAAEGGVDRLPYPWSEDSTDHHIDSDHCVYTSDMAPAEPSPVGTHPLGKGRWGHEDLAGNVAEWTWNGYQDCPLRTPSCNDCGVTDGYFAKTLRGGSYQDPDTLVLAETRYALVATGRKAYAGFRCVRDL